jgi:hypothetical protein
MNDKEIAGVKVFVSNETYDEYKGTLQEQINNLQSKIDKAIEYVENNLEVNEYDDYVIYLGKNKNELLDILKEDK